MTATDPAAGRCPDCDGTITVLGSGNRMCTTCGRIEDPDARPIVTNVIVAPFGMAPVEEVYPTHSEPTAEDVARHPAASSTPTTDVIEQVTNTSANEVLADQIGGVAFLEGGQRADVIGFPDYDHVTVRLGDGREETVPVSDVERIVAPVADRIPGVADEDIDAVPDVLIAEMALAEMIVRAAALSVREPEPGAAPVEIPQAFLPKGAAMLLVIERAAVSAVRSLFLIYDLDPATVLAAIDGEPDPPETGNQQQEASDEPSGTDRPAGTESEPGGK